MLKKYFCFFILISLCFLISGVFVYAGEDFDPNEMRALEKLHEETIREYAKKTKSTTKKKSGEIKVAQPKARTSAKVSKKKKSYKVDKKAVQKSKDQYLKEFQIKTKKKTLLERISIRGQSSLNFDSNVFKEKQAEHDFYYTAGAGIAIDATDLYKGLGFNLNYTGIWKQYFSFRRLNNYSESLGFSFPGYGKKLKIGRKMTVYFDCGISVKQNNDSSSRDNNVFAKQLAFNPNLRVEYLISKKFSYEFTWQGSFDQTKGKGETSQGETDVTEGGEDYTLQRHAFINKILYHITPKTALTTGFTFGYTTTTSDTVKSLDSNFIRVTGGIRGKLTPKSTVNLDAGWEHRTFKDGTKPKDSFYLQAAYLITLTRKLSGRITAVSDTAASTLTDTGLFASSSIGAGLQYKLTNKISIVGASRLRFTKPDTDQINSDVESGVLTAAEGESDEDGKELTFTADTSINYSLYRWLSLSLQYKFEARHAENSDGGYTAHLATLGVNVG